MPLNPSSKRLTLWMGVTILVVVLLWVLGPVLVPFAVAAVLAYALHPLVLKLQKLSPWMPRLLCVVLVEVMALCSG